LQKHLFYMQEENAFLVIAYSEQQFEISLVDAEEEPAVGKKGSIVKKLVNLLLHSIWLGFH
jgi:hypothetical protein